MKLQELDFVRLLPEFMRLDDANIGLSSGINALIPGVANSVSILSTWDRIDDLPESELDDLSRELNILWYDIAAPTEVKRDLVKNSDLIYAKLGTKWAVEKMINTYFGAGYVSEWFEYEGTPGHFRVYSSNPTLSNEKLEAFLNLLDKVKRTTAKLDGIFITLTGQMPLCSGVAFHETGSERYAIGSIPI